jgi:hypothetical protein
MKLPSGLGNAKVAAVAVCVIMILGGFLYFGYEGYYVSSSEKKAAFRVLYSIDGSPSLDPGIDRLIGDAHIAARTKKDKIVANQLDEYHLFSSQCALMRQSDEVLLEAGVALTIDKEKKEEQVCEGAMKESVEIRSKLMKELT